jgi:deoxyribonuclease-4
MLATLNKDNIGICIDTAHLWGAGEYRIDRKDEIDRMFHDYDRILGLETLQLVHLNDSCVDFGSRKDRHERVGRGKIWHRNTDVLRYFISSLETLGIAFILETVPEDYDVVYTLYKTDL